MLLRMDQTAGPSYLPQYAVTDQLHTVDPAPMNSKEKYFFTLKLTYFPYSDVTDQIHW